VVVSMIALSVGPAMAAVALNTVNPGSDATADGAGALYAYVSELELPGFDTPEAVPDAPARSLPGGAVSTRGGPTFQNAPLATEVPFWPASASGALDLSSSTQPGGFSGTGNTAQALLANSFTPPPVLFGGAPSSGGGLPPRPAVPSVAAAPSTQSAPPNSTPGDGNGSIIISFPLPIDFGMGGSSGSGGIGGSSGGIGGTSGGIGGTSGGIGGSNNSAGGSGGTSPGTDLLSIGGDGGLDTPSEVPLPASLALFPAGLLLLARFVRRRGPAIRG
jgi:hypothetical protein